MSRFSLRTRLTILVAVAAAITLAVLTAGFNLLRGPGVASWDLGVFRQFELSRQMNMQFRIEAFNVTNRPRFSNPGSNNNTNVSNLILNPDGSIRDLNGFAVITSTQDGSERQVRLGLRLGW